MMPRVIHSRSMSKKFALALAFAALALSGCEGASSSKTPATFVPAVTKEIESAVFGAPDSAVNLEIYSDYQCPACQRFHALIEPRLWKEYVDTKKISLTYKNYPLPQHQNAIRDAMAGLCALSEGKYREFSDLMYALEEKKTNADVSDAERAELATKSGVDPANFAKCLSEGWYYAKIQSEMADGNRLGLSYTPSVYLNGKIVEFKSSEEFFAILDAAIAAAK